MTNEEKIDQALSEMGMDDPTDKSRKMIKEMLLELPEEFLKQFLAKDLNERCEFLDKIIGNVGKELTEDPKKDNTFAKQEKQKRGTKRGCELI